MSKKIDLRDARIYHDNDEDVLRLTAKKSKELPEGFSMTIARGTRLDAKLRQLLFDGTIEELQFPEPLHVPLVAHGTNLATLSIDVGHDIHGEAVQWNVSKAPLLQLVGGPGSGKTLEAEHIMRAWLTRFEDLILIGYKTCYDFDLSRYMTHDSFPASIPLRRHDRPTLVYIDCMEEFIEQIGWPVHEFYSTFVETALDRNVVLVTSAQSMDMTKNENYYLGDRTGLVVTQSLRTYNMGDGDVLRNNTTPKFWQAVRYLDVARIGHAAVKFPDTIGEMVSFPPPSKI